MKKIIALLPFFLLSCSTSSSQNEKRLQENVRYAATLFQQEAPEALLTPLDSGRELNCSFAALDTLYMQQIQPADTEEQALSTLKKETKKKVYTIEKASPLSGDVCQRAFVSMYLAGHPFSKIKFPSIKAIEVVRKEKPSLFILTEFEPGKKYTELLASPSAFSVLGKALGEVHQATRREKQPLSWQWIDSISRLINSFSNHYQTREIKVQEAAQYISESAYRIMAAYEKRKKTFDVGLALGNTDLDNFLFLNNDQVLFTSLTDIGFSLQPSSPPTTTGLLSYDYCRLWHHSTLLSGNKELLQAFEKGYIETAHTKPPQDEILFFLLIDLMHRIDRAHHLNTPGPISLSLLEAEMVQWTISMKEMRKKHGRR